MSLGDPDNPFDAFENMMRDLIGSQLSDTSSFLAMMDDTVIVEHPYANPSQRYEGLTAVRAHTHEAARLFKIEEAEVTSRYVCEDDGVTIAEFNLAGYWLSNGQRFKQNCIAIMKVSGGKITLFREYWNPLLASPPAF